MSRIRSFRAAALAAAVLVASPAAFAETQGPGWFVPGHAHTAAPARTHIVPHAAAPLPAPTRQQSAEAEPAPPAIKPPPIPQLPSLPRGSTPPAAVIGVLSVPDVMHSSTAGQEVEKVIGGRRNTLAQDAQKEQASWRKIQQSIVNGHLKPAEVREREHKLQEKIADAQKDFRKRNDELQASAQVALGQIESTLIAVIRQVAESHGMNLVLHRAQVALNTREFDITDEVTKELNKILPSVKIPPEGVMPTAAIPAEPKLETATTETAKAPEAGKAEPKRATHAPAKH